MSAPIDLTGQRVGKLTVVRFVESRKGKRMWLCRCDCGGETMATYVQLKYGEKKSCGCIGNGRVSHGKSDTPTYKIWHSMVERCRNPNDQSYKGYGGRGITVCDRWKSFQNFLDDMGEKPPGLSLDRIDNNGDYSPENCRWATALTQASNRRTNVVLSYNGISQSIAAWARDTGLTKSCILHRLKSGWTIEQTLTISPSRANNQRIKGSNLRSLQ